MQMGFSKVHPACHSRIKDHYLSTFLNGVNDKLIIYIVFFQLWCQALHVLCQYFTVCNFLWMFCEGLYLNVIMVYAFSVGKSLMITCHIIGWGKCIVR